MKWLASFLILSTSALAQQAPTEQQVLGSTIGNLFIENARLAVELQKAQTTIQALQKEKADAKQIPSPSATDGRGGSRPEVRQEGGSPAEGRP